MWYNCKRDNHQPKSKYYGAMLCHLLAFILLFKGRGQQNEKPLKRESNNLIYVNNKRKKIITHKNQRHPNGHIECCHKHDKDSSDIFLP